MSLVRTLSFGLLSLVASGVIAGAASAETPFQANHPRRAEVLSRDAHERAVIRAEGRDHVISRAREHRLLVADRHIARQEQRMARANGGFITHREQRTLNREENRVDRHIGG